MCDNKSIREKMIKKYGDFCMMEEAGIRYIPDVLDENRQGRSEADDRLTYHHLTPVKDGGLATEENGAILRWNNHKWLESQSKEVKQEVAKQLQQYKKMAIAKIENAHIQGKLCEFDMSDTFQIPLFPIKNKNIDRDEMER